MPHFTVAPSAVSEPFAPVPLTVLALATNASQGLSSFLIVRNLRHAHDACRLNWRLVRIHPHILRLMLIEHNKPFVGRRA